MSWDILLQFAMFSSNLRLIILKIKKIQMFTSLPKNPFKKGKIKGEQGMTQVEVCRHGGKDALWPAGKKTTTAGKQIRSVEMAT